MISKRQTAVMKLWNITEKYNTLHQTNWSEEVKFVIAEYQEEVIKAIDESFDGKDIPDNLWSFSGALLYSITVIITIGYGHMVPLTPIGKIVTIVYAVIGVPLFLLYLSNIGEIFATSFKWTYSRICKCQILRGHRRKTHGPAQYRVETLPQQIHPGLIELQKSDTGKGSIRSRSIS